MCHSLALLHDNHQQFEESAQPGLAKIKPPDLFELEGNEILPFVQFKDLVFSASVM